MELGGRCSEVVAAEREALSPDFRMNQAEQTWRLKAVPKHVEEVVHGDIINDNEDLLEDNGGDSGDAMNDSREYEQRIVMTQMVSLIVGCLLCPSRHVQGTKSNSDKGEQMIEHQNQISVAYQIHYNNRDTRCISGMHGTHYITIQATLTQKNHPHTYH